MKICNIILRKNKYFLTGIFCFALSIIFVEAKNPYISHNESSGWSLWAPVSEGSNSPSSGKIYLTSENVNDHFDQDILNYINEMRTDPKAFYQKYIKSYIKEKSSRFTAEYTHSLRRDMFNSPALPAFSSNSILRETATSQLNFLAQYKGRFLTHEQGNLDFAARMQQAGLHCLAENLYAADDPSALDVVLDLLIDQGVPSLGHRKNLMNPVYTHIGIVSETPAGGRMIVVMDFGCK